MFTIDAFLNAYMKKEKLKQTDLAKRLGLHINTLRNWLSCRSYPSMDVTQDVLSKLGYDVIIVDKQDTDTSKSIAERKPVCSFTSYEMAIYERGRKSVYEELSDKIAPVNMGIERKDDKKNNRIVS